MTRRKSAQVEQVLPDGSVARWTWERRPDRTLPVRLVVDAPDGITMRALRALNLIFPDELAPQPREDMFGDSFGTIPGHRVRTDDAGLARLAASYAAWCAAGSRRPAADLASELTAHGDDVDAARVRQLVLMARRRGLLTGTAGRGVRGGRLTEKAKALLRQPEGGE